MTNRTIGYIVGSLSSTSINRRLAKSLERLAPEGTTLVEIPIADLPFYSPDHDGAFPQAAREFKSALAEVDGVIIVTPEYSRSIPGVLKNALDWSVRPYGQGSFNGKPTAAIGTSGGPVQHRSQYAFELEGRFLGGLHVRVERREQRERHDKCGAEGLTLHG